MTRISLEHLAAAIQKVSLMNPEQQEQLVDEIFVEQPHMLGSALVQTRLGVSFEKMKFVFEMLFICYQAMKESGLSWPLISEDQQEKCMAAYLDHVKATDALGPAFTAEAMERYQTDHPEKALLAFVVTELTAWSKRIVREDSDNFVILATMNLVNCIAHVSLADPTKIVIN